MSISAREDEPRFEVAGGHEELRGLRLEVGAVRAHRQGRREAAARVGAAQTGHRGGAALATEGHRRWDSGWG